MMLAFQIVGMLTVAALAVVIVGGWWLDDE